MDKTINPSRTEDEKGFSKECVIQAEGYGARDFEKSKRRCCVIRVKGTR